MINVDFWVEGIADQIFLSDVMRHWYGLAFRTKPNNANEALYEYSDSTHSLKIRSSGGYADFTSQTGWHKKEKNFSDNYEMDIQNVLILDADDNFAKRREDIITTTSLSLDVLFLWPNNASSGDLETLLEQITHPDHQAILSCWDSYEACLRAIPSKNYAIPTRKSKIYAYLELLLGKTEKKKERERDYTNADHWNLDPQHPSLNPLHTFLNKHLKP